MRDRSGEQIDNFRLESRLGRGGQADVYRATDTRSGATVAVKMHRIVGTTQEQRFQQEVQVLKSLEHPNIVQVLDHGECGGDRYLVMEYLEGKRLDELVESETRIEWPRAFRLFEQACAALNKAHEILIHRDVKPQNMIVVCEEGGEECLKVLDFGLAKMREPGPHGPITTRQMGSWAYASPEQVEGKKCGPYSDVYSLGVSLYQVLSGKSMHARSHYPTEADQAFAHKNAEPTPLSHILRDKIAEEDLLAIDTVVMKAVCKDPRARYQTAGEFGQALRALRLRVRAGTLSLTVVEGGRTGGDGVRTVEVATRRRPASSLQCDLGSRLPTTTPRSKPRRLVPARAGSGGAVSAGVQRRLGDLSDLNATSIYHSDKEPASNVRLGEQPAPPSENPTEPDRATGTGSRGARSAPGVRVSATVSTERDQAALGSQGGVGAYIATSTLVGAMCLTMVVAAWGLITALASPGSAAARLDDKWFSPVATSTNPSNVEKPERVKRKVRKPFRVGALGSKIKPLDVDLKEDEQESGVEPNKPKARVPRKSDQPTSGGTKMARKKPTRRPSYDAQRLRVLYQREAANVKLDRCRISRDVDVSVVLRFSGKPGTESFRVKVGFEKKLPTPGMQRCVRDAIAAHDWGVDREVPEVAVRRVYHLKARDPFLPL